MDCDVCRYYDRAEERCYFIPADDDDPLPCENNKLKKHDWTIESYTEYRRAIVRKSQQKRRTEAAEMGQCSICAANPARPGMKTCGKCGDRSVEYAKKRRTKEKE